MSVHFTASFPTRRRSSVWSVLEQSDEWQIGRYYMAKHSLAALTEPAEPEAKELEQAA